MLRNLEAISSLGIFGFSRARKQFHVLSPLEFKVVKEIDCLSHDGYKRIKRKGISETGHVFIRLIDENKSTNPRHDLSSYVQRADSRIALVDLSHSM